MTPRALSAALTCSLLLGAVLTGCGATRTTTLTASSPSPTPDVFDCARAQLKALDFGQNSLDTRENRVTAKKYIEGIRRPDVNFRRLVDRLEVEVTPGADGTVTVIAVEAKTFAESTTHRGPTEEQETTSETARAAAQTIVQKCSQPVDSLSVPG